MPHTVKEARIAPLALTCPAPPQPLIVPPEMTPRLFPALQPVAIKVHLPSNLETLPLAPPPRAGARRASDVGLLLRAGRSGSELPVPDTDLSSLPMIPPVLPCAKLSEQSQPAMSKPTRITVRQTGPR
jgi:hypothetical protein